jgi:sporulation protein YlmC with PRC-barrel domain
MIQCCNMKYSEVRGKDVIDVNGVKVGNVIDCIFDISESKIDLKHFVLGGGMVEELLESIGARPDIDPVANIADVDSISDKVYLNVDKDSLCQKIDPGILGESNLNFGQLGKLKIVDADGLKIGNVIDFWFDTDSQMWLVLGGGFFEELLEKIRAQPDIDLLVPLHYIGEITKDKITLTKTKFQLESTCESEYEKEKKELLAAKGSAESQSRLRLGPSSRMRPF